MATHIFPINDIKLHVEEGSCACSPRVEVENGELIFIHNSFDGRELLERLDEILEEEALHYHRAHCTNVQCLICSPIR